MSISCGRPTVSQSDFIEFDENINLIIRILRGLTIIPGYVINRTLFRIMRS